MGRLVDFWKSEHDHCGMTDHFLDRFLNKHRAKVLFAGALATLPAAFLVGVLVVEAIMAGRLLFGFATFACLFIAVLGHAALIDQLKEEAR